MSNRILAYERIAAVASVPDWTGDHAAEAFVRTIAFEDLETRNRFVADVQNLATEIGHSFQHAFEGNAVTISLTTAEVGGLSELDVELAQAIDSLIEEKY